MKRLRNTAIYYIVFGILLALSFAFFKLWPIALVGIALLVVYVVLRFAFHTKQLPRVFTKEQLPYWDWFLGLSPFLYAALSLWYVWRPYRQTIILPQDYEGVVAVQYDKPNGQPKKWTTGFLKICPSRLIEVDSTGIAETQFTFHHNTIPLLGLYQTHHNRGGLAIYYENNLRHEIVPGFDGTRSTTLETSVKGTPNIYMTGFNYYPLMIFVVTKPENYHHYFMTEKEIETWMEQRQKQSNFYVERPRHKLNAKYKHYYQFKEYYYNKLN